MSNNNAQIFVKNFGKFELSKYAEPDGLKTLVIDDVDYQMEYKKVNGGEVVGSQVDMMPGDTTINLNSFLLKRDNARMYEALRNPTILGLGPVTVSNGNNTFDYSNLRVVTGFKQVGNPAEFQAVVFKFVK